MLGKHVSGHSFSMTVDQRVISSFKLVARPGDVDLMGSTNVAKGLFDFAGTHDLLRRFVVLKKRLERLSCAARRVRRGLTLGTQDL